MKKIVFLFLCLISLVTTNAQDTKYFDFYVPGSGEEQLKLPEPIIGLNHNETEIKRYMPDGYTGDSLFVYHYKNLSYIYSVIKHKILGCALNISKTEPQKVVEWFTKHYGNPQVKERELSDVYIYKAKNYIVEITIMSVNGRNIIAVHYKSKI